VDWMEVDGDGWRCGGAYLSRLGAILGGKGGEDKEERLPQASSFL